MLGYTLPVMAPCSFYSYPQKPYLRQELEMQLARRRAYYLLDLGARGARGWEKVVAWARREWRIWR